MNQKDFQHIESEPNESTNNDPQPNTTAVLPGKDRSSLMVTKTQSDLDQDDSHRRESNMQELVRIDDRYKHRELKQVEPRSSEPGRDSDFVEIDIDSQHEDFEKKAQQRIKSQGVMIIGSTNGGVSMRSNGSQVAEVLRDVEEALEKLGGFGLYQRDAFFVFLLCFQMGSLSLYPMGFYELMPQFECSHFDEYHDMWTAWKPCMNTDFCEELKIEGEYFDKRFEEFQNHRHRVDQSSSKSLDNWVIKYDMQCSPKSDFGYFGSLYFVGVVLGSFIIPRLSDMYGRKKFFAAATTLHVISCTTLLLSQSLRTAFFLMFLIGIAMSGRAFVGYVWMSESLQIQHTTRMTAFLFCIDSLGIFLAAIYFKYISKNWVYFYSTPLVILFFAAIKLCLLEESPKFLYATKQYDRLRKVLTVIGRKNGKLAPDQTFNYQFQIEQEQAEDESKAEKTDIKEFAKTKQNVTNLIIFIILNISCNFIYYLINFYIKYIPGDIYLNQIINSVAESVANGPLSVIVASLLPIKKNYFFCFVTCAISCSFIYVSTEKQWTDMIPLTVLMAKSSVTIAFCALYFSTLQFFPSSYLGLAMGIQNMIGRMSTIAAPVVAEMSGPAPMAVSILLCISASISACMLKKVIQINRSGMQKFKTISEIVEF